MYDVFLSYSHSEFGRAVAVREHLIGQGLRVWMDDPGAGADVSELGIPAGSLHEEVIAAAIADSGAFLALGGPAWRSSDYCQGELRSARRRGRRVLHLGPDTFREAMPLDLHLDDDALDDVADHVRESTSFSAAQVRLDAVIADRQVALFRVPVWSRLSRTPGHREATRLMAEPRFGELLTDDQRQAITQILQEESDRIRWLRRMMAGWTAIVLVAALVAGVAFVAARRSETTAVQRAAQAESERWAAAALAERHSGPAFHAAQRALLAERNAVSEEAARVAGAAASRLETWPIPRHSDYTAVAFAPSGERISVTTGSTLLIFDAQGAVTSHPIPELGGTHTWIRWPAEDRLWILSRGLLREYAVNGNRLDQLRSFEGINAFDLTPDGRVVAGRSDRSLALLDAEDAWTVFGEAPSAITGLRAAGQRVFVSTESLETQRYTWAESLVTLDWTINLAEAPVAIAGSEEKPRPLTEAISDRSGSGIFQYTRSETSRDDLAVCGDDVLLMLNRGSVASGVLRLSQEGVPTSVFHRKWYLRGIACWDGAGVGAGRLFTSLWSESGRGSYPLIELSDRFYSTVIAVSSDGQRLATVSTAGVLRIADRNSPSQDTFDTLVSLAPLTDGGWLAQDFRGELHRFDGETLAPLGTQEPQAFYAQAQSGTTVVLTEDGRLLRATSQGLELIYPGSPTFTLNSWALAADGASVVIAERGGRIRIVDATDGSVETVPAPIKLEEGELLADVAMKAGTVYAVSSTGRLWALNASSGAIRAASEVTVIGSPALVFRPGADGGAAVASRSGQIVLLDQDLHIVATRRVSTFGGLQSSEGGGAVLWVSSRTLLMGGAALDLTGIVAFEGFEFLSRLVVSADGDVVALWQPAWRGSSTVTATGMGLLAAYREDGVDPATLADLNPATLLQIPLPR